MKTRVFRSFLQLFVFLFHFQLIGNDDNQDDNAVSSTIGRFNDLYFANEELKNCSSSSVIFGGFIAKQPEV